MNNGSIIGKRNAPTNSIANGIWSISEQYSAIKSGSWPLGFRIVDSGLILKLDAKDTASYPGSGSTWFDTSGNNNHVTLYGSPTFSNNTLNFNGSNQYAITTNNLDFSPFNSVTIEIYYKSSPNTNVGMLFEHTTDWNSVLGGFGLYINSRGGPNVPDFHHSNRYVSSGFYETRNFGFANGTRLNQYVNTYSKISDSTGRIAYTNGALQPFSAIDSSGGSTVPTTTQSTAGSFVNAKLHLANRNAGLFLNCSIARVLVYNRKLTAAEVLQNYQAHLADYGT
jgi:hypothetical protein